MLDMSIGGSPVSCPFAPFLEKAVKCLSHVVCFLWTAGSTLTGLRSSGSSLKVTTLWGLRLFGMGEGKNWPSKARDFLLRFELFLFELILWPLDLAEFVELLLSLVTLIRGICMTSLGRSSSPPLWELACSIFIRTRVGFFVSGGSWDLGGSFTGSSYPTVRRAGVLILQVIYSLTWPRRVVISSACYYNIVVFALTLSLAWLTVTCNLIFSSSSLFFLSLISGLECFIRLLMWF